MKKNAMLVIIMLILLVCILTFRGRKAPTMPTPRDTANATLTVRYSPSGKTDLYYAHNGSGVKTGEELCVASPVKITLQVGDTADMTYKCNACGLSMEFSVDSKGGPYYLCCNCPEDGDTDGDAWREYIAVEVEIQ
jgi:hypothetical protein